MVKNALCTYTNLGKQTPPRLAILGKTNNCFGPALLMFERSPQQSCNLSEQCTSHRKLRICVFNYMS